jgi:ribosome-associated toxin RatA of RatAB toxin-antitoxin module
MREIRRSALVPVSPQRMFELINDVERYPQFVPGCHAAEVLERQENLLRARLTVGSGALHTSFVTRNRLEPHRTIQMDLEEGPFRSLTGRWTLTPLGAGELTGCNVELVLRFEMKGGLTGLALGPLVERMAASLVDAFVIRARQDRAGEGAAGQPGDRTRA